ncbi:MAG: tRNA (adenosine(37)-N6)-threonylcarbamoyltransferase complex dimerization subunit type 1 TsaB [Brevundimonas sp.]|uniref:tRNA (adenosine(37)-N6)-threonylcarbamoyltransferase complex dimerization subunit type 1 TsaB n=1 Tax=Brevundimonas sp. TaxID=1871086 RepID=UPI003919E592
MRTLIVDTALGACTVVVSEAGRVLAGLSEPMARGHQEALAPMAARVLSNQTVDQIAASCGPGSFTGLRVGLAFAEGLALALGVPCRGFSTLHALALEAGKAAAEGSGDWVVAAIDARRGQVYAQALNGGRAIHAPVVCPPEEVARNLIPDHALRLFIVGTGASLIEASLSSRQRDILCRVRDVPAPGQEALARLVNDPQALSDAAPLYLRGADAKPPTSPGLGLSHG